MVRLLALLVILLLPACSVFGQPLEPSDAAIQRAVQATATALRQSSPASPATPAPAAAGQPSAAATPTSMPSDLLAVFESADQKRMDNDFAGALTDVNRAVALAPANGETYNLRALVLVGLGRYAEALTDADRAVQLAPDFASIDTRAYVYLKLKRYADALAEYGRLAQISPEAAQSFFVLLGRGLANAGLGDMAKARPDLEDGLNQVNELVQQGEIPPDPEIEDLVSQAQALLGGP